MLRQGETSVAIVTIDTVGLFNGDVLEVRKMLADAGHDIDHLVVHALHNHEGPDTMGMWGEDLFTPGYDPKYREQLHTTIVELIGAAIADTRPVEGFKVGEVDISTFHENGVANVVSDHRDPWVVDEFISAAHLVDADDQTIVTLINYGCHPETLADENLLLTSDFVHALLRYDWPLNVRQLFNISQQLRIDRSSVNVVSSKRQPSGAADPDRRAETRPQATIGSAQFPKTPFLVHKPAASEPNCRLNAGRF